MAKRRSVQPKTRSSAKAMQPLKFLFIGNSFTARNDLLGMIQSLAAANGIRIEHHLVNVGGASLPGGAGRRSNPHQESPAGAPEPATDQVPGEVPVQQGRHRLAPPAGSSVYRPAVGRRAVRPLESTDTELKQVDLQIQQSAFEDDKARLLMTLPGVGHGTAVALLAALDDIDRFRDGHHAAAYLGLVPSTRQSADHCYHGPITKAGSARTRWMLTQGVQHVANHPGPLGVFFRRLCKRKNRNVAISAVARKLVTIAYLMLKNNEPYHYAVPQRVHAKFTRIKHRVTGKVTSVKAGHRPADLPAVCQHHRLSPVRSFDQLPPGERRMLEAGGIAEVVQKLHGQA